MKYTFPEMDAVLIDENNVERDNEQYHHPALSFILAVLSLAHPLVDL